MSPLGGTHSGIFQYSFVFADVKCMVVLVGRTADGGLVVSTVCADAVSMTFLVVTSLAWMTMQLVTCELLAVHLVACLEVFVVCLEVCLASDLSAVWISQ